MKLETGLSWLSLVVVVPFLNSLVAFCCWNWFLAPVIGLLTVPFVSCVGLALLIQVFVFDLKKTSTEFTKILVPIFVIAMMFALRRLL